MALQVITANRLDDGLVVYWNQGVEWVDNIAQAARFETAEEGETALAEATNKQNELVAVGPYLIDVELQGDAVVPLKLKEVIRTKGPTVRLDLGNQAQ